MNKMTCRRCYSTYGGTINPRMVVNMFSEFTSVKKIRGFENKRHFSVQKNFSIEV